MTAPRQPDLDAEREVDLARWRRALVALWWIPVAGLVLGAIVGVLYSFRGGATYKATSLISLGSAGRRRAARLVNGFGTNPRAVSQIVSSAAAQEQARRPRRHARLRAARARLDRAGRHGDRRRRRARNAADLAHGHRQHPTNDRRRRERAGGDRRRSRRRRRTSATKIKTFQTTLATSKSQLAALSTAQLAAINAARQGREHLDPLQQLVIVSQDDNAETRQGNLIAQQETTAAAARVRDASREREGDHGCEGA